MIPVKTWYVDTNVIPSGASAIDAATSLAQYQRIVLNRKLFVTGAAFYEDGVRVPDGSGAAGAWPVISSSDGVTAGAGDRWLTPANIIQAAGARSWIVLRSPAGWLPGGAYVEMLIDVVTSAGTSEGVTISVAPSSNPFAISVLPATPPALPANGVALGTHQISEYTAPADHKGHFWRNSEGDVILTSSRNGSGNFGSYIKSLQGESGESISIYPCTINMGHTSLLGASALIYQNLQAPGSTAGWSIDNTPRDAIICFPSSITAGLPATTGYGTSGGLSGRNPNMPIDLFQLDPILGLYHGRVPDVRYGSNFQANLTLESTADAFKRMNVGQLVLFKHDSDALPSL
jgi:hypothetical protein